MDVLTSVLDALRLKSTLYCRSRLSSPWRLRFAQTPCATFHVVLEGTAWLHLDDAAEPLRLGTGDVIALPGGSGHSIFDAPESPLLATIHLEQYPTECLVENWAAPDSTPTTLLCGTFELEHDNGHPFLSLLPAVIHLRAQDGHTVEAIDALLAMMAREVASALPGAQTLLRRLADMLFIQIVRHWAQHSAEGAGGWLAALHDPQIGAALELIHGDPSADWTVAGLAAQVAMSRSAFAERFTALVGEAPFQYLTRWRMRTAARLLSGDRLPLGEIALRVGYESEFAFSKAFKRAYGMSPGAYRKADQRIAQP